MLRCGQTQVRIRSARVSLYERVGTPNILSCFVVGRPRPEYGLPVAVIEKNETWVINPHSYNMIHLMTKGER